MAIESINSVASTAAVIGEGDDGPMSLEDRLVHAGASLAASATQARHDILQQIASASNASNPHKLMEIQVESSNYSVGISFVSTLARKAVSTVETLLKS